MPAIPEKADLKKYVGVGTWDQNRQVLRDALDTIQGHLNRVYTASMAMVTDADGVPGASATTAAELGYLHLVTGPIQAQLNAEATTRGNADTAEAAARANADALLAPLASPAFTGDPTRASPPALHDNDASLATTAYVQGELADLTADQAPTLGSSWANYDTTTYFGAKYWKDALGYVHLAGRIKDGTVNSSPWSMGVGFVPSRTLTFPLAASNGTNNIAVVGVLAPGGGFTIVGNSTAAGNWVSLDGVCYRPT